MASRLKPSSTGLPAAARQKNCSASPSGSVLAEPSTTTAACRRTVWSGPASALGLLGSLGRCEEDEADAVVWETGDIAVDGAVGEVDTLHRVPTGFNHLARTRGP